MTRKIIAIALAAGLALPGSIATVMAGERHELRRELRQQLRHDRHERHEARDKLRADIAAGNRGAIASDKAALDAASAKVRADKDALHQFKK